LSKVFREGPFIVRVPDLSGALGPILLALDPKKAKKIYRKALTHGGRVLLAEARRLAPNAGIKRKKNQPIGHYGRSGLLRKSLKVFYRDKKSPYRPYVVIGVDRDVYAVTQRGRRKVNEIPKSTVHLVEDGFVAVSRVSLDGTRAGRVKGRDINTRVISLLRSQRGLGAKSSEINMRKALSQGLDQKLLQDSFLNLRLAAKGVSRDTVESYIRGYKAATKTVVRGRKFLERAQKAATAAAKDKALAVLQAEYANLVKTLRVI
jgi:hypothetical protein